MQATKTIERLRRAVILHAWLNTHSDENTEDKNDNDYTPGLYLPSTWTLSLAPTYIENGISAFEGRLNDYFEQRRPNRSDNLTFFQRRALKKLQADTSLHVCDTDKNLGPAVIDKRVYLKQVYEEHLSASTNIRLNENECKYFNDETRIQLKRLFHAKCGLPLSELTYLKRASVKLKRIHQLYVLPKIHIVTLAWRPIISCVGGELEAASNWLDYQLRKIANAVSTYLRDSQEAITSLREMGFLPPNARLFTADARAMYIHIEPAIGIAAVQQWLIDFASELPEKFPSAIVISALEMVMTRNTFQFDDTYWQQFVGTAMGPPCACVYTTVAYGYHERTHIIKKKTKKNMPYLKRFIDNMLEIWCDSDADWIIFKASLNGFGRLKWICCECVTSVTFLDLTITIYATSKTILTKTYQKPKTFTCTSQLHPPTRKHASKEQ
jgi:hypothetical protein